MVYRLRKMALLVAVILLLCTSVAAAQTPGLVAGYGFNETSGNTVTDDSGNNNAGTLGSGITRTTAGKFGGALVFNGTSYVNVPHAASLNLTTAMTLEAWVFPTVTPGNWSTIFLKERPGGFTYSLYTSSVNRPNTYIFTNNGEFGIERPTALPLNVWSHVAATYNGTTLNLYVNGTLAASQAFAGTIVTSTGALRIGGNGVWGSEYFTGRIDEIRIYNRVLSQAEIQSDMNTAVGGTPPDSTGPAVAITSHTNNQTVTASPITVSGTASDSGLGDSGISSVTVNGVAASGGTAAGSATANWSRSVALNPGPNTITVVGRDNSAAQNSTTVQITVNYNASDTTAPSAVTNLATGTATVNSVALSWTAPGDDGSNGTATSYDIRYALSQITEANWGSATQASGEPAPLAAGSIQNFTLTGLSCATTYFFALKTSDEVPNTAGVSNSPSKATSACADSSGPAVAITSHSNDQTVTASPITVSGTASDSGLGDSGISSVTVNGVAASGGTAAGSATANWSRSVALNPGPNTITVVGRDNSAAQNSTTVQINVNFSSGVSTVPGSLLWAKRAGGTGSGDAGTATVVDGSGNIYVTGTFQGTATFGLGEANQTTLTSDGSDDIFLTQYDSNGLLQWVTRAGGVGVDRGVGIALDGLGNLYVTGLFNGTATFGLGEANQTALTSGGSDDIFVARYDSSGILQWAKRAGGTGLDRSSGIAVDDLGNSYVAGWFNGTATFGLGEANQTTLASDGSDDIFVAQYDSTGTLQWAGRAGGTGQDQGVGIAVDGLGNSYLTGFFSGAAAFGPGQPGQTTLNSAGGRDLFVAQYDSAGLLQWVKRGGGTSADRTFGIAADESGNIYVTGTFQGTATFGLGEANQTTLTSAGSDEIFVGQYDSSGLLQWMKRAGGTGSDSGIGIAVDVLGNSYVTGWFSSAATFGSGEANQTALTSAGNRDVFVAQYDSNGLLQWTKGAGSAATGGDQGMGIALDGLGNSYVPGYFNGTATFGSGESNQTTLTSAGGADIFVAKFAGNDSSDIKGPALVVTSHTNNQTVTASPITVSGTASDSGLGDGGISSVTVNGVAASGGTAVGSATANWSQSVALNPGPNTITVVGRDNSAAQNSTTVQITVNYNPSDTTAPSAVTNLATGTATVNSVTLSWTAPGDDGSNGTATSYDIRYALSQISEANWGSATQASGEPAPLAAGSIQNFTVTGLSCATTYFFALKTSDEVPNTSVVSNSPSQVTSACADSAGPAVAITSHSNNQTVTASPITVSGTASDSGLGNSGILSVTVNGVAASGGTAVGSATANWSQSVALNPGPNTITVVGRDNSAAQNSTTVQITINYNTGTQPAGLVAGYGFNETSGNTVSDDSGNNNAGTLGSGITRTTAGKFGGALVFNGTSYVNVPHAASLNLTTAMTLEAWVFPTVTPGNWSTILLKERPGGFTYSLYTSSANRPNTYIFTNNGEFGIERPSALPLNVWSHVAATYNGTTLSLYVNGTLAASQAFAGTIVTSTGALRIGGNGVWGSEYFTGRIDEIRIYNRVLSQAEIQSDMNTAVGFVAPRIIITQPAEGSTIAGATVDVSYTASGDLTGVDHAHFRVDNGQVLMDIDFDGSYQINNVPPGSHVLEGWLVRADHSRILGTEAFVSFATTTTVGDTIPPTIAITSPAANATVQSTISVAADASDNVDVVGVQFFLDGAPLGTEVPDPPYSTLWDTTTATPGSHTLAARARDAAGNTTMSVDVAVTVQATTAAQIGSWSAPFNWPIVAVHTNLLPTGDILSWDGPAQAGAAQVWSPSTNSFISRNPPDNIFCAGHCLLPDGRLLVVGGNIANYVGLTDANIFNPTTLTWTQVRSMASGRWYPTAITLPDGRVLVVAGDDGCHGCVADIPEIYDAATNTWVQLNGAANPLPEYPHLYVLPDGRVLSIASFEKAVNTQVLDLNTQTWTIVDPNVLDAASSAMYRLNKFVKSGTAADSNPPYGPAAATTYVLDMAQSQPAWQQTAPMAFPRSFHNFTILPDGNVLVTGGGATTDPFNQNQAVLAAELWSPATETWTTMASGAVPRLYHSNALLLPDGRVLINGGGRFGGGVVDDMLNGEIYSPPYLFKGPRPTITSAPNLVAYNANFSITSPDAAQIASVSLIPLGTVTHGLNTNQRYLSLSFQPNGSGLDIQAPANANIAPPGFYMLFILNANGVPSVGAILRLQ